MASRKISFNLETLKKLDNGRLVEQFNQALKEVIDDMRNRPREGKPRKVSIGVTFKPTVAGVGPDAELDKVDVEFDITSKRPALKPRKYTMLPHRDGQLSFNPDEPTDPLAVNLPFEPDDAE